jgi:broad specificity phosphatase PhoE
MARAVATGYSIAEALDLPLLCWVDIHETGGMFSHDAETGGYRPEPGLTRDYLAANYPRLVLAEEVTETGWWNRPFEPREDRAPRAQRVLAELLARHGDTDDEVVFVSHGGFINYLLKAILGTGDPLPESAATSEVSEPSLWFGIHNASLTRVDFKGAERFVAYVNRTDYLPADLIT